MQYFFDQQDKCFRQTRNPALPEYQLKANI